VSAIWQGRATYDSVFANTQNPIPWRCQLNLQLRKFIQQKQQQHFRSEAEYLEMSTFMKLQIFQIFGILFKVVVVVVFIVVAAGSYIKVVTTK